MSSLSRAVIERKTRANRFKLRSRNASLIEHRGCPPAGPGSENEEQAGQRIIDIYDRVRRQVYVFLPEPVLAILLSSLSLDPLERPGAACLGEMECGSPAPSLRN